MTRPAAPTIAHDFAIQLSKHRKEAMNDLTDFKNDQAAGTISIEIEAVERTLKAMRLKLVKDTQGGKTREV